MYMKISYYAVLQHDDDGLWVYFPDLPGCFSCGDDDEHAEKMAKEALELYLHDMAVTQLPNPIDVDNAILKDNQKAVLITADLQVKKGKLFSDGIVYYSD